MFIKTNVSIFGEPFFPNYVSNNALSSFPNGLPYLSRTGQPPRPRVTVTVTLFTLDEFWRADISRYARDRSAHPLEIRPSNNQEATFSMRKPALFPHPWTTSRWLPEKVKNIAFWWSYLSKQIISLTSFLPDLCSLKWSYGSLAICSADLPLKKAFAAWLCSFGSFTQPSPLSLQEKDDSVAATAPFSVQLGRSASRPNETHRLDPIFFEGCFSLAWFSISVEVSPHPPCSHTKVEQTHVYPPRIRHLKTNKTTTVRVLASAAGFA